MQCSESEASSHVEEVRFEEVQIEITENDDRDGGNPIATRNDSCARSDGGSNQNVRNMIGVHGSPVQD